MSGDGSARAVIRRDDGTTVLGLSGDLDMAAVGTVEARLREALEGGPRRLVLDLAELTFLDSSGIRLLLRADELARARGVELAVTRPPAAVWGFLERFRLDSRLPFVDDGGRPAPAREGPPAEGGHEVDVRLDATSRAPGLARHAAAGAMAEVPAPIRDAVLLLVSEVVTNAVRHGCSDPTDRVHVSLRQQSGTLRVEVEDPGPGVPASPTGGDGDRETVRESGWGLVMVESLASRWGIARDPSRVWFELDLTPED